MKLKIEEAQIIDHKLVLPKKLLNLIRWRFPFYQIPKLKEYNQKIVDFSKTHKQLPFFTKFDINNDGKEEIIIIQKPIIGGFGSVLIISLEEGRFKFDRVKWRRPVNALFFDYSIGRAEPRIYQTFGLIELEENVSDLPVSKKIDVKYPHLLTHGYLSRVVYWDGLKYCQERISFLSDIKT